jgi:hypothetical protein
MLCKSYRRLCRRSANRFTSSPDNPHPADRNPVEKGRKKEEKEGKKGKKVLWKGSFGRSKQ